MNSRELLTVWQIAFTYVGAVVGAGFATGQEIQRFFVAFGKHGLLGALTAGAMFAVLGWLIICTTQKKRIVNYGQFVKHLYGPRWAGFFDGLTAVTLFCGLAVMLVAGSGLFTSMWGLPSFVGFFVTAAVIYLNLLWGQEGLLWANTLLMPGLIILCLAIAGTTLGKASAVTPAWVSQVNLVGGSWFFASVLYVAYNLVLGTVVLSSLGRKPALAARSGVVLGGLLLGLLAAFLALTLYLEGSAVSGEEIPMLFLAERINPQIRLLYFFGLWAAVLTTGLADGFGLLKRLEDTVNLPRPLLLLLIFLPTLLFFGWSLSTAVGLIYPLLGYLGLTFIAAILWRSVTG